VAAVAIALALPLVWLLAEFARQRTESVDQAIALSEAYRGTALLLGDVVEADDSYTGLHSRDVVTLVLSVCEALAVDADSRHLAELTARLHDVGKVEIPKEIIRKPGPLTPEERAVIETHTVIGERMLKQVGGLLEQVGELVRSCHERWDGGGYPDRLAGADIPLVARIVCACDAFSAMTTDRSYRSALSHAEAIAEMRRCAGTQFDPEVVAALVAALDDDRPATLAPAA
jgi:HD-GYP domain-containing protein (c-di-GMP phosphodiesterase class II)